MCREQVFFIKFSLMQTLFSINWANGVLCFRLFGPSYYFTLAARIARLHVFSNRSVKQREDILTNKLAANTHMIARKTQIAQRAAINNWGDTWNIIRWWAIVF